MKYLNLSAKLNITSGFIPKEAENIEAVTLEEKTTDTEET